MLALSRGHLDVADTVSNVSSSLALNVPDNMMVTLNMNLLHGAIDMHDGGDMLNQQGRFGIVKFQQADDALRILSNQPSKWRRGNASTVSPTCPSCINLEAHHCSIC
jgi:hypothetical protein